MKRIITNTTVELINYFFLFLDYPPEMARKGMHARYFYHQTFLVQRDFFDRQVLIFCIFTEGNSAAIQIRQPGIFLALILVVLSCAFTSL